MDWIFSNLGWIIINIFLPPIVPLFGIVLVGLAPAIPNAQILAQVKDGQLNWMAIGMCAQALYELSEARHVCEKVKILSPRHWDVMNMTLTIFLAVAFLLAPVGAIFVTPIPRPIGSPLAKHYKILLSSLFVACISSLLYILAHYNASSGCSAISEG